MATLVQAGDFTLQSKATPSTPWAITFSAVSVLAGDDIFAIFASDANLPAASNFSVNLTGGTIGTPTLEVSQVNAAGVAVALYRIPITAGGTLQDVRITGGLVSQSQVFVANVFRGVGARRDTTQRSQAAALAPSTYVTNPQSVPSGDFVIGGYSFEGPATDWQEINRSPSGSGLAVPTEGGHTGTTGGGAASNIGAGMTYTLSQPTTASPPSGTPYMHYAAIATSRDTAGVGAWYEPYVAGTNHEVSPSDTLSLSDSATQQTGKQVSPADTLSVADSASQQSGKQVSPADTLTVADAARSDFSKSISGGGAGGFPSVGATATGQNDTLLSSHTVNLPTGIASGDRLLVAFTDKDVAGADPAFPGGWTVERVAVQAGGATLRLTVASRVADGSEGSTITVTTTNTTRQTHISARITGGGTPEVSAAATGNNGAPDPPALTPAAATDALWIAVGGASHSGDYTAAPTNYGSMVESVNATTANTTRSATAMAFRDLNTGSAEDPGAFTYDQSTLSEWAALTIAIPAAAASGGDSLTLADSATVEGGRAASVADTLSVADSVTTESGKQVDAADSLSVADSAATAVGRHVQPTDTLTLADDARRDVQRGGVADTLTLTDAARSDSTRVAADTLTLADSATASEGHAIASADTLTLSDSARTDSTRSAADTLTVADDSRRDSTTLATDTLTLADSVTPEHTTGTLEVFPADALSLSDSVTASEGHGQSAADTLTLADAVSVQVTRLSADTLTVADASTRAVEQASADAVSVADQPRSDVTVSQADTLALSDSASTDGTLTVDAADTLAVSDSARLDATRASADTLAVSDSAATARGAFPSDALTVSDAARWDATTSAADSCGLADAAQREIATFSADSLGLADLAAIEVAFELGAADTLTLIDDWAWLATIVRSDTLTLLDAASTGGATGGLRDGNTRVGAPFTRSTAVGGAPRRTFTAEAPDIFA
jgi:hypothetical protein